MHAFGGKPWIHVFETGFFIGLEFTYYLVSLISWQEVQIFAYLYSMVSKAP